MDQEQDLSAHQKGGMLCPGCGMELQLNPVDHNSEASGNEGNKKDEVSMEDAQTMPLAKLREKLPKKAE